VTAPHYAEAFFVQLGRCFRMLSDVAGRPEHCPMPPTWRGAFRDGRVDVTPSTPAMATARRSNKRVPLHSNRR
jgi:hypothetical protein